MAVQGAETATLEDASSAASNLGTKLDKGGKAQTWFESEYGYEPLDFVRQ